MKCYNKCVVNPFVKVKTRVESQRGFGFVSILVTLAIIGLLYFGYRDQFGVTQTIRTGNVVKGAGQEMACQMNRQALERAIMTWSISHPGKQPTLKDLENDGITILPCPDGGRFRVEGEKVYCSLHSTSG